MKTDPRVSRTEEEVVLRMGVLVGSGTPKRDAIWLKGDLGCVILRWCRRVPPRKMDKENLVAKVRTIKMV